MSYFTEVGFTNDNTVDAFGRVRTSQPVSLVDGSFIYDLKPLRFNTAVAGGGTVVKTTNESSVTLSVGTVSGDSAQIQSKLYAFYQPGKSQLIQMTGVLGAAKANVKADIGYNDQLNGVFFTQNNGMFVVLRSNTSGSVVDTAVAQANWNIDKMDGTGPSGLTIDFTKAQLFVIDLQWLSVGRVRYGFSSNGVVYYCHSMPFLNSLTVPYSNSACLPIRWKISNTGTSGGATSMKAICGSVSSESGSENLTGLPFTTNNGITTISITTRRPILSIQPQANFNGIVNRQQTIIDSASVTSAGGTCLIEVVLNGTLTGASFSAVDTNSAVNKDTAATAISGGTVIGSAYVSGNTDATRGVSVINLFSALNSLNNSIDGLTPDIVTLVCTSFTGTNTATGIFNWHEIR